MFTAKKNKKPAVIGGSVFVLLLVSAIIGVEAVILLAEAGNAGNDGARAGNGGGLRLDLIRHYGLFGDIVGSKAQAGVFELKHLHRLFTHFMISHSGLHTLVMAFLIFVTGSGASAFLADSALAIIFLASTLIGAIATVFIAQGPVIILGANAGAYGMIGAFIAIYMLENAAKAQARYRLLIFFLSIFLLQLGGGVFLGDLRSALVGEIAGFGVGFLLSRGLYAWERDC